MHASTGVVEHHACAGVYVRQMYVYVCVYIYVYVSISHVCAVCFPAKTQKTENSNLHGFEVHRPSSKSTKLLLQIIKAIINHLTLGNKDGGVQLVYESA